ncbi:MAG: hypothetical protein ACTHU0_07805 [Kofleriaceae bacterium]
MKRFALVFSTLLACGKNAPPRLEIGVDARLDGSVLLVDVDCLDGWRVEALGQTATCSSSTQPRATLRVSAEQLGAGPHTITVMATHGRDAATRNVSIDIPATALGSFFALVGCASDHRGQDKYTSITVANGDQSFPCQSFHGPRAKASILVNRGAKLRLGGRDVAVPDTGRVEAIVELGDAILDVAMDDFAGKAAVLAVPWQLEASGQVLEGKLTISEAAHDKGALYRMWLRDLVAGKIDRAAFRPPAAGEVQTLVLFDELRGAIATTRREGTVRDLDLVAMSRVTARREAGACRYNRDSVAARRFDVDLEVAVTSLADGRVIATRSFPAPADCPSMTVVSSQDPEVEVSENEIQILKWLEPLASTKR